MNAASSSSHGPDSSSTHSGKYLTCNLGEEEYGLGILKVQEIIGMMHVTRVPGAPPFVRGVVNLRGKVIPVIDLRTKFGLPPKEDTERTCIIVLQVQTADRPLTTGIVVDEVSEVVDIDASQIEDTPSFGDDVDVTFIKALGKMDDKVIIILDVDKVLSSGDLMLVGAAVDTRDAADIAESEPSTAD